MVVDVGKNPLALITNLIDGVHLVVDLFRRAPFQQHKCAKLAQSMQEVLIPVLEEMRKHDWMSTAPLVSLGALEEVLKYAKKSLREMIGMTIFKRALKRAELVRKTDDLVEQIFTQIRSLPVETFRLSTYRKRQVDTLTEELRVLHTVRPSSEDSGENEDHIALTAQVLHILRLVTDGSASLFPGHRVLDDLFSRIATTFKIDSDTVRKEWEDLCKENSSLRRRVEYQADTKRKLEDDFLKEVILYMQKISTLEKTSIPVEFECPICKDVMREPVVCQSGQSFCKICITTWFHSSPSATVMCPTTKMPLQSQTLFPNTSLQQLIARWEGELGEVVTTQGAVEPSFSGSVDELISALKSDDSEKVEILQKLARQIPLPCGLHHLHSAVDGVSTVASFLSSSDPRIQEEAVCVFEEITWQVRAHDSGSSSHEERDIVCKAVIAFALTGLIKNMQSGSPKTRMSAAEALKNLIANGQYLDEVRQQDGIVMGFFRLSDLDDYSDLGKELCIKGLSLLRGETALPRGATESDDKAIATALVRLVRSLPGWVAVVEEALVSLSLHLSWLMKKSNLTGVLLERDDIIFLVRLLESSAAFAGGARQSWLGCEVLSILGFLSSVDTVAEQLMRYDLCECLLPGLTDSGAKAEFVILGVKLLNTCIAKCASQPLGRNIQLFQVSMRELVEMLRSHTDSEDLGDQLLSMFVCLFEHDNGGGIISSFLDKDGFAALMVFEVCERVAAAVRLLATCSPKHEKLRSSNALEFFGVLLRNERSSLEAVLALEQIVKHRTQLLQVDNICFPEFVELLNSKYSTQCREAVTFILSSAYEAGSRSEVFSSERTIELLLGVIRGAVAKDAQFRAAGLLLSLTVKNCKESVVPLFLGQDGGFSALVQMGTQHGSTRKKTLEFVSLFSRFSDETRECVLQLGGLALLKETLKNTDDSDELRTVSIALQALFSASSRQETARFIKPGILEVIFRRMPASPCRNQLEELMEVIADGVYNDKLGSCDSEIQMLVELLARDDVDVSLKRLAAWVLSRILLYHKGASAVLRVQGGLSPLICLVAAQAEETGPLSNFGNRMESLFCLNLASEDNESLGQLLTDKCIKALVSIMCRVSTRQVDEEAALLLLKRLSREAVDKKAQLDFRVKLLAKRIVQVIEPSSKSAGLIKSSSVEAAIGLIRNLTICNSSGMTYMLQEKVVDLLLGWIRSCAPEEEATHVAQDAVITLGKFMEEEKGRRSFLDATDGVSLLVGFLDPHKNASIRAKGHALQVLVTVLKHESAGTRRRVCSDLWELENIFIPGLSRMWAQSPEEHVKNEARRLLDFLLSCGLEDQIRKSVANEEALRVLIDSLVKSRLLKRQKQKDRFVFRTFMTGR